MDIYAKINKLYDQGVPRKDIVKRVMASEGLKVRRSQDLVRSALGPASRKGRPPARKSTPSSVGKTIDKIIAEALARSKVVILESLVGKLDVFGA